MKMKMKTKVKVKAKTETKTKVKAKTQTKMKMKLKLKFKVKLKIKMKLKLALMKIHIKSIWRQWATIDVFQMRALIKCHCTTSCLWGLSKWLLDTTITYNWYRMDDIDLREKPLSTNFTHTRLLRYCSKIRDKAIAFCIVLRDPRQRKPVWLIKVSVYLHILHYV